MEKILPSSTPIVQSYEHIMAAFPGGPAPALVVVKAPDIGSAAARQAIAALAGWHSTGIGQPIQVSVYPAANLAEIQVPLAGTGADATSQRALATLHDTIVPATVGKIPGGEALVGGTLAGSIDFNNQLRHGIVPVFVFVLGITFILMLTAFRSIVIAATTIVLNLLSVAAAYGAMVAVFQHGWGAALLGTQAPGAIESWILLFNLNLPAWTGPQPSESAVHLLTDAIGGSARPVTLVTLGPFTDIALALQADPGIGHKIAMIYAMAGAVRVNGNEPKYSNAEWNVYIDAVAASRVLRSGVPMTFVPLDATGNVPVTTFVRQAAQAHPDTPALRIVGTMLRDPSYTNTMSPTYFWDPLAAVAATDQQAVQLQAARLAISTGPGPDLGSTRISPAGSPVRLALSANQPAFERQFLATLNGGQPVPITAVPAARQLAVSYDGHDYAYRGPRAAGPGQMQIRLANRSAAPFDGFSLIIGKLAAGRTLADVQAVIRADAAPTAPPWFQGTAVLPAVSGADPAWGVALTPGRYALVCVLDRSGALYALTELTIG